MGPDDVLVGTAGKFPFLMVLTSTFLDGGFFLVFNIPVITSYLGGASLSGVNDLLIMEIIPIWSRIIKSMDGIALVTLFLFLSILAGIFLAPFSRGTSFVGTKLAQTLLNYLGMKKGTKAVRMFSSTEFLAPENADFLSWIIDHPAKKLHWEWQLFGCYVYWGTFLNVMIFSIISSIILWPGAGIMVFFWFAIVCVLFYGYALAKSKAMGEAHAFYEAQFKNSA